MSGEKKGRSVRVGGVDLHFNSIEALELWVEKEKRALVALESDLLAHNPRDPAAWAEVEQLAAILQDLVIGLDDWIKADEVELDAAIVTLRQQIRSLRDSIL